MNGQAVFEYLLLVTASVILVLIVISMLTYNVSSVANEVNGVVDALTSSFSDIFWKTLTSFRG